MNRFPSSADNDNEDDDDAAVSSPNSTISSFQMDFAICHAASAVKRERDGERDNNANDNELDRDCSRGSDEEEGGGTRKKLRLSKEQSAYLEESFKEHNTLNPVSLCAL